MAAIFYENTCPNLRTNQEPSDLQSQVLPFELSEHVGALKLVFMT